MRKIRVLQFPISANSGVKQYAMNNWRFIDRNRFDFIFALVRKNDVLADEIQASGAGVRYVLASAEAQRDEYVDQVKQLLSEGYDAIHLHTSYWKRLLIEELAVECQIPKIIVHSHNTFVDVADSEQRAHALQVHMALREEINLSHATDFCACSNAAADWLFGAQIPRERIRIMKNAIDTDTFLYQEGVRKEIRNRLGLDGSFVLGHIGRFSYQKNHTFLINTFAKVCKKYTNAKLMLIGEGPLEQEIKRRVAAHGLSNRVLFLGQRNDVPALLQAMDIFCLPSEFEGLGIALVEAQTAGLPCLISPHIPEEGVITSLVTRLPLETDVWVQAILSEVGTGRKRTNMLKAVTEAGYNIREEIKNVETLYTL